MKNRLLPVALAVLAAASALRGFAADAKKACSLVTPPELEAVLGEVPTLKPQGGEEVAICSGRTSKAGVLLRLAKARGSSAEAANAGVEMARKAGMQVEVKTFGPVTCSSMTPPDNLKNYRYNTTCTVTKDKFVAGIEITAKSKADMVPIDRLRPVAEKMAGRF